jgi:hypothetical protein
MSGGWNRFAEGRQGQLGEILVDIANGLRAWVRDRWAMTWLILVWLSIPVALAVAALADNPEASPAFFVTLALLVAFGWRTHTVVEGALNPRAELITPLVDAVADCLAKAGPDADPDRCVDEVVAANDLRVFPAGYFSWWSRELNTRIISELIVLTVVGAIIGVVMGATSFWLERRN